MGDVVVTVPRAQWPAWLREGDLPGQAARGVSHFWLAPPLPPMAPGERVYVVASNRLRGYAPLVGVEERCALRPHDGMGCFYGWIDARRQGSDLPLFAADALTDEDGGSVDLHGRLAAEFEREGVTVTLNPRIPVQR